MTRRTQLLAVLMAMLDGEWRTLEQVSRITGAPEASVSARLRDLRKAALGAWRVERERARSSGPFWYRVLP